MKKIYLISILIFILTACSNEPSKSKTSTTDSSDINNANTLGGNTTPSGPPLITLNIMMAGKQSWTPGSNMTYPVNGSDPVISVADAKAIFATDSRLKVRFKAKSQPVPTNKDEYCYGRADGFADSFKYKNLKFDIRLRDIVNFNNSLVLSDNPYSTKTIQVSVDKLSEVIDLSQSRNKSNLGTVLEITNVRSDSDCQFYKEDGNEDYIRHACPSEITVRSQSCWNLEMYVSTDSTQDM